MIELIIEICNYIGGPAFVIGVIIFIVIIIIMYKVGGFSEKIKSVDAVNTGILGIKSDISEMNGTLSHKCSVCAVLKGCTTSYCVLVRQGLGVGLVVSHNL